MLDIIAGVGVILSSVIVVFGCVCHLFKRGPGFTTFENDLEAQIGNTVFTPGDTSDISQVTFETIPDILAKTVTATALRPRISCVDSNVQKRSAKRVASYKAFPRSHLTYIKEMGIGWFGQVLVGEAYNMVTSSRSTCVIVKMMKDDASANEQQLFLLDLAVYRELDHPNIMKLLGQCTEASPFLAILEYGCLGDLKSYLQKEHQIVKTMKDGTVKMQFLTDMAAGLECLHTNGYLHHDFACRNCLVFSNMTVKIGDYGTSEDHYREDYYDNGQDLLPIRWMAPELITLSNSIWQMTEFTPHSNVWSFGVAMYEVTEYGQQPYKGMSDEQVLQNMVNSNGPYLPHTDDHVKLQLYQIMQTCWQKPESRFDIKYIFSKLRKIQAEKDAADEEEFERKWTKMSTREPRVVKVEVHASDIGLKLSNSLSNESDESYSEGHASDICLKLSDFKLKSLANQSDESSLEIEPPAVSVCINTPTHQRPMAHQFTSTPVVSNGQNIFDKPENIINEKCLRESSCVCGVDKSEKCCECKQTVEQLGNEKAKKIDCVHKNHNKLETKMKSGNDRGKKEIYSIDSNDCQTWNAIPNNDNGIPTCVNKKACSDNEIPNIVIEIPSSDNKVICSDNLKSSTDNDISLDMDENELEKLKELKLTLTNILPLDEHNNETDNIDTIELYMSKGMSMPASKYTSTRSLDTILEDELLSDCEVQTEEIPSKVSEDFSISDTCSFEWDDYTGDELIGNVKASEVSPQRSIHFPDWTMEHDSFQDSSINNESKQNLNSSLTENKLNSGAAAQAYVKNILSNSLSDDPINKTRSFYSFSHDIDMDEPSSPTCTYQYYLSEDWDL